MEKYRIETEKLSELGINELLGKKYICYCGREHSSSVKGCDISSGAMSSVPDTVKKYGVGSVYVVCDDNTYKAAAKKLCDLLDKSGIKYRTHIFSRPIKLEPDEAAVGQAVMDYKNEDMIIGIGGGVINDICKFLKKLTQKPYMIVGTAPSMDGFASDSSSMIYNGVKTTIYTCTPDEIVCDLDIMKDAPHEMILAGIGDMAAKYISICEWRISHAVNGEYYCEQIADIMRKCARKCCEHAEKAVQRDVDALKSIVEGLVCAGIAMNFANNSRPASGVEHYYSHLWEMRAIEEHRQSSLHGISVGVGTLLALKKYDVLKGITPSYDRARTNAMSFDPDKWKNEIKDYFGSSADAIIAIEEKEKKYDPEAHEKRILTIIEKWDEILAIINEELVPYEYLYGIFERIGAPLTPEDIGETAESAAIAYIHTRDIRDKYILSRLTYDLGVDDVLN